MARLWLLMILLTVLSAGFLYAGGGEEPRSQTVRVKTERIVSPDPEAMTKALGQAREAAGGQARPAPAPVPVPTPRQSIVTPAPAPTPAPRAAAPNGDRWMLGSREGGCAPLDTVKRKVENIGTFSTPEQFAHQLRQRGHQSFALDVGDQPGQVVKVKVPDLNLDLLFMKQALCR